jgi:hypothetical protein
MEPDQSMLRCVPGSMKNCMWGSLKAQTCMRCDSGYTQSNDQCVISKIEGCLATEDNFSTCKGCNSFEGYSAVDEKTCKKF